VLDCKQRQFKACRNAGLFENVGEMSLNSFFAETELRRDIAIAGAFYDATHHVKFARSESEVVILLGPRRWIGESLQYVDEIGHAPVSDPVLTC